MTSGPDNDMPESRIDSRPAPATRAARPTIVSVMNCNEYFDLDWICVQMKLIKINRDFLDRAHPMSYAMYLGTPCTPCLKFDRSLHSIKESH